jgi:AcrR family transcriptional regulator
MANVNLQRRAEIGQARRERTRAALFDAAMKVFSEKGLEAATTDDIIKAAGVSRGTFYNYFDAKEDVLKAVAGHLADQLNDQILDDTSDIVGAPERLAWTLGQFLQRASEDKVWGTVIIDFTFKAPTVYLGETSERNMKADLDLGRQQGCFTLDNDEVAYDIIMGVGLLGMRSVLDGKAGPDHAYLIAERVLLALGTPLERASKAAELARPH